MKAIETRYAGCRFRSRLEARWAVFFDRMGIGWQYEPQGFMINDRPYLPDFLLECGTWIEVKGDEATLDRPLMKAAARQLPGGLLILGPIPNPDSADDLGWIHLGPSGGPIFLSLPQSRRVPAVMNRLSEILHNHPGWAPVLLLGPDSDQTDVEGLEELVEPSPELSADLQRLLGPGGVCDFDLVDIRRSGFGNYHKNRRPWMLFDYEPPVDDNWLIPVRDYCSGVYSAKAAYLAARSARFEHGQSGT